MRRSQILGLIYSDIYELNNVITRGDKKYLITFLDDYSRFSYVHLLKNKFEAHKNLNLFRLELENQLEKKIKILRFDRGGEYLSNESVDNYKNLGIYHEVTAPYSPYNITV